MRTIFAGIKTLTKAIAQVIKNVIVKIKNGLIKIFSPIFHFFKIIIKGIFFVIVIFKIMTEKNIIYINYGRLKNTIDLPNNKKHNKIIIELD